MFSMAPCIMLTVTYVHLQLFLYASMICYVYSAVNAVTYNVLKY